ncbi:MAG TPA: hypothetical protein VEF07_10290 [Candidatus Binataceae bacterium]|nr:hypothetical protein [Candidatus Binataceae bacterium]
MTRPKDGSETLVRRGSVDHVNGKPASVFKHRLLFACVRKLRWLLALAVIVLCGCAYALVHGGTVDVAKADQVKSGIQKIRELNFKSPVPLVVKTRDEAERIMIAEIARDHSDEDLRIGGLTGAMTGLFPPGIDLKGETLKLLRSQIAGFYEPHEKQMVLVEDRGGFGFWNGAAQFVTRRDPAGEMLLAHELTHALQDQAFGIDAMLKRVKDNDDRSLALKSVAEGDATLAGFAYIAGGLTNTSVDAVVSKLANLPEAFNAESGDVPEGLSTPLLFQYSGGTRFVGEAWRRGGWAKVNALYANPPASTQQIMQPELYFDHPSPPARITIAGYADALKGWKQVDDDTYGELLLGVILKRNLPARAPALGTLPNWAGDRILVFEKGKALTLVWIIAFRNDASAAQFARAYGSILDHLRGENNPHRVEARSATVLIVIGQDPANLAQLASDLWMSSKVDRIVPAPAISPAATAGTASPEPSAIHPPS